MISKNEDTRTAFFEATLVNADGPQLITLLDETRRYIAIGVPDNDPKVWRFLAVSTQQRDFARYLDGDIDLRDLMLLPEQERYYLALEQEASLNEEKGDVLVPLKAVIPEEHLPEAGLFAGSLHTEEYTPCRTLIELKCRNHFNAPVEFRDMPGRLIGYSEMSGSPKAILLIPGGGTLEAGIDACRVITDDGGTKYTSIEKYLTDGQAGRVADFIRAIAPDRSWDR